MARDNYARLRGDTPNAAEIDAAMRRSPHLVPCHLVSDEPSELQVAHFARTAALRPGVQTGLLWQGWGVGPRARPENVAALKKAIKLLTGKEPEVIE